MGGGGTTASREQVNEDTALNYSAVWCATRVLCGTGASLPLPLFKGLRDETRVKDRDHPLYQILNHNPNPEMTAYNFRSVMWQWQVNWGNAFAEITREGDNPEGEIVALWPIHPSLVQTCRDEDDSLYYRVHNLNTHQDVEVEPWRILHIPSIITVDGYVGRGVIEHARESIGAGIAAEKYGANWFGGGSIPRIVIEHPGKWTADQRDSFRKEWDEIHSGAEGSKVALLMGGAIAKPLSMSANDSQFLGTRQFGVEEVARWYGIPPHLLQHLLQAKFNNVEQLGIDFVQYSLIPWMRIWEQCIWLKLLTYRERKNRFVEHNVDGLLRGDTEARTRYYQGMTAAALMTRNECRKKENLDPVDGGDTFLVQGATVPLDEDGKPESEFVNPGGKPKDEPAEPEPEPTVKPVNTNTKAMESARTSLFKVIQHDMARFLTKEQAAIGRAANKPREFVTLVDEFYVKHAEHIRGEVVNTFDALDALGVKHSAESFVDNWINEGKSMAIEVAGKATAAELSDKIQQSIADKSWSERPLRAVEGVMQHATSLV